MKQKCIMLPALLLVLALQSRCENFMPDTMKNPLVTYSAIWNNRLYDRYNTAADAGYLTEEEKNVLWVLNLARAFPQLFLRTVVLNPLNHRYYVRPEKRNSYFNSLISKLRLMEPIAVPLLPDSSAFISARCHAIHTGMEGTIGHDRANSGCVREFQGECCDYGNDKAVDVLLNLLIDDGIPGVGHRLICLSDAYTKIGVAMQPHKVYGINTVMDFKW